VKRESSTRRYKIDENFINLQEVKEAFQQNKRRKIVSDDSSSSSNSSSSQESQ
jgi:hypothetical protein